MRRIEISSGRKALPLLLSLVHSRMNGVAFVSIMQIGGDSPNAIFSPVCVHGYAELSYLPMLIKHIERCQSV